MIYHGFCQLFHLFILYFGPILKILFEFLALYQFLCTDIQHKRASRFAQHPVDLIDPDIAVFGCFPNCQSHFLVNRNLLLCIFDLEAPFLILR